MNERKNIRKQVLNVIDKLCQLKIAKYENIENVVFGVWIYPNYEEKKLAVGVVSFSSMQEMKDILNNKRYTINTFNGTLYLTGEYKKLIKRNIDDKINIHLNNTFTISVIALNDNAFLKAWKTEI